MKVLDRMKTGTDKVKKVKMDQGWQWLLYLDIVFPFILFVIALLPLGGLSTTFAGFYHNYNMFIICPIPNIPALIGIVGLVVPIIFMIRAIIRRKWLDLVLCGVFLLAMLAFFGIEIDGLPLNYHVIKLLDFGAGSL